MITSANNSANITPNKKTKNANNMTSKTEATNTNAKAETTTGTTTTPPDMITPSYVAKSKWNEVVDQLPNETLQAITRTYTNRLHQLRLQREKHQGTHERHTQPGATLPASCLIKFELGASAAIRERPAYQELKTKVERSIEETQSLFKKSIVQLQVLEMQVKEEEIQKMFCEGLCKIAMALINHHRDTNPNLRIAKTMQSMRLADRLVELLMEQHGHILEFSYLVQEGPPSNRLPQYYGHVGRDQPTHSAKQNRNNRSSPYNPHHTRILEGLLPEFKDIVEPCFHSSWKEYLEARSKLHQKQTQAKAAAAAAAKAKAAEPPKKDKQQHDSAKRDDAKLPSAQALKEMVHNAVTEETRALTDKIRHLEEQLQQKEAGAATPATATAATETTNAEGGAKKGRNRRNKKNNENGKEEEGAAEPNKEEAKPTPNGNQKEDEAKAEEEAKAEPTAETGTKGKNRRRNRGKNNNDNANNTEGEKKVEPANANQTVEAKKDDEAKTETPAPAVATTKSEDGEATKEEATNGANDGAATGNKKKRNRKRNKGKGGNATNEETPTNGATAADTSGEAAKATNGAKPENGNTNGAKEEETKNGNANEAEKEEAKNGNASGNKAEAKNDNANDAKKDEAKPASQSNGNANGVDHEKLNGKKKKNNKKKNNNPQAASMHDSTTEMFGSYHSTGDKNWS